MIRLRNLTYGLLAVGAVTALYRKYADTSQSAPVRFIDAAMLQGLAEIEAARLALERTGNDKVKEFARQMIEDHTAINRELEQLGNSRGYPVAGTDSLAPKARDTLLNLRSVQSFDQAYAEHQITAHRKAIDLYRRGTRLDDFDISNFARATQSKMEHHLAMTEQLADELSAGMAPATAADAAATAEVDSGLSSGSPQQNRGDAANPHH
ncbi:MULTISPECIES: DUF4142 domain-containing protein [Halopseudomonas]|uniref:DUF4142 domain-containing protein n=1 Tax=Halopseudomonas bauzanensis TaxID=653930 RepID=A0A4U0YK98_9GAMM|nr:MULTISPECIES: DUF4142 domain-containing protein [Halopseudomonas]TKA91668.1 DUF4142 domain-containing protein [Halopseudomonas bauzanensis]WGK60321.1 DUF4142 domain-containing protein [Halopseudomonas sp. SMJS2]